MNDTESPLRGERRIYDEQSFAQVAEAAVLKSFREGWCPRDMEISVDRLVDRITERMRLRRNDILAAVAYLDDTGALRRSRHGDEITVKITGRGFDRAISLGYGIRARRNDWRSLVQRMREAESRVEAMRAGIRTSVFVIYLWIML